MAKSFKGFRFDPELYAKFKKLATSSGLMVTEAFEKFMEACVNAAAITFPTANRRGVEAEARVLLAWLRKGKWFYSAPQARKTSPSKADYWLCSARFKMKNSDAKLKKTSRNCQSPVFDVL